MDQTGKRALFKAGVCFVLWLVGVWVYYKILAQTGNQYPMLDENTFNPRFSEKFSEFMFFVGVGWTAVCIVIGYLWLRGSSKRD